MIAKGPENYIGWKNVMRFGVLKGVSVVLVIEGAAPGFRDSARSTGGE